MTKAEIVTEIARATGIEKIQVAAVVDECIRAVKNALTVHEPVYMRGFGSFIIKHRKQKTARNITRKTTIVIPARDIPAFKPSKSFAEEVRKGGKR